MPLVSIISCLTIQVILFLRFDGKSYHSAGSSLYSHRMTLSMANYVGKALTTGCETGDCLVKTELMNMETLTWSRGPEFPFAYSMYEYSTASTSEAAYFIGGSYSEDVIAEFKNDAWRQLGTLARGRYRHGSITLGDETMVIGGFDPDRYDPETEIWNFTNENHKVVYPRLPNGNYEYGIGLYIVPFDFCTT